MILATGEITWAKGAGVDSTRSGAPDGLSPPRHRHARRRGTRLVRRRRSDHFEPLAHAETVVDGGWLLPTRAAPTGLRSRAVAGGNGPVFPAWGRQMELAALPQAGGRGGQGVGWVGRRGRRAALWTIGAAGGVGRGGPAGAVLEGVRLGTPSGPCAGCPRGRGDDTCRHRQPWWTGCAPRPGRAGDRLACPGRGAGRGGARIRTSQTWPTKAHPFGVVLRTLGGDHLG